MRPFFIKKIRVQPFKKYVFTNFSKYGSYQPHLQPVKIQILYILEEASECRPPRYVVINFRSLYEYRVRSCISFRDVFRHQALVGRRGGWDSSGILFFLPQTKFMPHPQAWRVRSGSGTTPLPILYFGKLFRCQWLFKIHNLSFCNIRDFIPKALPSL